MILLLLIAPSIAGFSNASSYWEGFPHIYNCSGSGISNEMLEKSLEFWNSNGMHHYDLKKDENCSDEISMTGGIYIVGDSDILKYDEHARSRVYFDDATGEIMYSHIFIKKEYQKNFKILTHELGHSFGLSHVFDTNDIMFFNAEISELNVTTN